MIKTKTAEEKKHMDRVQQIGCIACLQIGYKDTPAEIHHIMRGRGGSRKSSHMDVLPICPPHHRTGGLGVALHAGIETWEKRFGTEQELLEKVKAILEDEYDH